MTATRRTRVAAAALLAAGVVLSGCSTRGPLGGDLPADTALGPAQAAFPTIDSSGLTDRQQRFLRVVEAEYNAQPRETRYTQGVEEPWCADFVTWVAKETGDPMTNPNSSSWRIPGVYTLAEAFQAAHTFKPANSGYTPKLGDVVLYDPASPWGHHTNLVLSLSDGKLTTVGGNEFGGISVSTRPFTSDLKITGYGVR